MTRLRLTLAIGDYDHTRDLALGAVRADGVELIHLALPVEEIFFRFTKYREWDVSEMSFGKVVSLASQDDRGLVALPVFPSRVFRLSSIYVRGDGPVRSPGDLAGKRIGVPEWAQTAAIYTRGYIAHELGLPLADIEWVQAGLNEAGRVEKVALKLPPGIRLRPVRDATLNDMLLGGELDAVLSARPPRGFAEGRIARLYRDYREPEEAYFQKTGVFPIMHVLALRREVFERDPWVAMNLFKAFEEAKRRSLARLADVTASHAPLAWIGDYSARMQRLFGDDPWPYGVEPNRRTLEAFLQFAFEQGVCHRRLAVEELFPAELATSYRV
ncbi:MAG TPA: 4,5-dihydroxyphthalate decarboxylase [Burkholderiales bacterium]|nr:4,5-dihydroxyphthalate decarboxylase [Burkholderiales bacterium]